MKQKNKYTDTVVKMCCEGKTAKEIMEVLNISESLCRSIIRQYFLAKLTKIERIKAERKMQQQELINEFKAVNPPEILTVDDVYFEDGYLLNKKTDKIVLL